MTGLSLPTFAASTILVMGDSLSASYGMQQEQGWVSLLQQRLNDQGYSYRVANASISGETSSGGLSRIKQELAYHKPDIVMIALGANDGLRGLPLMTMRQNLGQIIQHVQSHQARILLIGMQLPPNYGYTYNAHFRQVFIELAQEFNTALLSFLLQDVGEHRELFQADGLHPTAQAQPVILQNVWQKLLPLLQKQNPTGSQSSRSDNKK